MRHDTLLSPGPVGVGFKLRHIAAQAISQTEISATRHPGGKTEAAKQLAAFFTDCASKLSTLFDAVAPTVTTRVRTAANTVVVTFNEPVEPGSIATSAFVFTPARVVTAAVATGSTVVITATGAVATDSVAYTKPTSGFVIKDGSANEVANFSGVVA